MAFVFFSLLFVVILYDYPGCMSFLLIVSVSLALFLIFSEINREQIVTESPKYEASKETYLPNKSKPLKPKGNKIIYPKDFSKCVICPDSNICKKISK